MLEAYRDDLSRRSTLSERSGFGRGATMSRFTASGYLRPLKSLASWLSFEGWLEVDPFDGSYDPIIPSVDRHDRILKIATPDDVRLLLKATSGDDALSLRDRAFVALDWGTGGRTSELCRLAMENLGSGSVLDIIGAKGDRDRQAGYDEFAETALQAYLEKGRPWFVERMERRCGRSTNLVFISEAAGTARCADEDGHLTASGVLQMLTRRWRKAGGTGSYGAHRFRQASAPCSPRPGSRSTSSPPSSATSRPGSPRCTPTLARSRSSGSLARSSLPPIASWDCSRARLRHRLPARDVLLGGKARRGRFRPRPRDASDRKLGSRSE